MSKKQPLPLYLKSGSLHEKQLVLEVGLQDLLAYFSSPENKLAHKAISEVVSSVKANCWNFWSCCFCDEKFASPVLHSQHVESAHLNKFLFNCSSSLPLLSITDWESLILKGIWKPIDPYAALPILKEQFELLCTGCNEAFDIGKSKDEGQNTLADNSQVVTGAEASMDGYERRIMGKCSDASEYSLERKAKEYFLRQSWPLSDDLERETILTGIRHILQDFLSEQTFTELLVKTVVNYSMKELRRLNSILNYRPLCLNQTHICICLLGASPLQNILNYLKEVRCSINMILDVEQNNNILDSSTRQFERSASTLQTEFRERVALAGDSVQIFLDERSLGVEINFDKTNGCIDLKDGELPVTDALFKWIWTGPSCSEQVESWTRVGQERKNLGTQILQALKKNDNILNDMFEEKNKLLCCKDMLESMWDNYRCELAKRKFSTEHVVQSYEELLKNLLESTIKFFHIQNKFLFLCNGDKRRSPFQMYKAETISCVLKEAQLPMHEKTFTGLHTSVCNLNILESYFAKVRSQADYPIEDAVKRVTEINSLKLLTNEACIMHTLMETQRLKSKVNLFAANDYRAVLLPIVKSYLQAHMKQFAGRGATMKSEFSEGVTRVDKTADCNKPSLFCKQIDEQRLVSGGTEKDVRVSYFVAEVWELSLNTLQV